MYSAVCSCFTPPPPPVSFPSQSCHGESSRCIIKKNALFSLISGQMHEATDVPRPCTAHAAHCKARQPVEISNMHAQVFFWTKALMSCSLDAGPQRCSAAQELTALIKDNHISRKEKK